VCGRRKDDNSSSTNAVEELSPETAMRVAEDELFNCFGVTKNDHEHIRDYFYGTSLMRSVPQRSESSPSTYDGSLNSTPPEGVFCHDEDEGIREYQNEIWQSLNEWIDYMFPDACRSRY
jgi:hypothetical protein